MMPLSKNIILILATCFSSLLISGCQQPPTSKTAVAPEGPAHVNHVKTKTSSYVYLSPMPQEERTVYIDIKNDSGNEAFDARAALSQSLQAKSFTVVQHIDKANLVLRANLFRLGNVDSKEVSSLLNSDFGNSAPLISLDNNTEKNPVNSQRSSILVIVDAQYFQRKELIDPLQVRARQAMSNLSGLQLLLLCNTLRWERFQTRLIVATSPYNASQEEKLAALANGLAAVNTEAVRGLSV